MEHVDNCGWSKPSFRRDDHNASVSCHWTRSLKIHPLTTSISFHEGKTVDGRTFEQFLGDESFEQGVMAEFDEFLQESFSK
jgi:hypothetical protein